MPEYHPVNAVRVVGAEGFVDDFPAYLVPGLGDLPARDDRGTLAVIVTEVGDLHVVPASTLRPADHQPVESPQAKAYREEWAVKADRNPRDVYIPEALR